MYAICFCDSSGWQHLSVLDGSVVVWICPIAHHVYLLICLSSSVLNVALAKVIRLCVGAYLCVGVAGPEASVCLEQLSAFIYFFRTFANAAAPSRHRHSAPQSAKVVYYFHTLARKVGGGRGVLGIFSRGAYKLKNFCIPKIYGCSTFLLLQKCFNTFYIHFWLVFLARKVLRIL